MAPDLWMRDCRIPPGWPVSQCVGWKSAALYESYPWKSIWPGCGTCTEEWAENDPPGEKSSRSFQQTEKRLLLEFRSHIHYVDYSPAEGTNWCVMTEVSTLPVIQNILIIYGCGAAVLLIFRFLLLCSKKHRLEKIRPCKHEPSNQSMKESTLIIGISLVLHSYNIEYNSFHSDCVSIN